MWNLLKYSKINKILLILVLLVSSCSSDSDSDDGPDTILVQSILVLGADITDGTSSQFTASITPVDATNSDVVWTVSDEEVATISNNGLLTALDNGSVVVTATAADGSGVFVSKTVQVTGVDENVDGIIVQSSEEILSALINAKPGDAIYIRGGVYNFTRTISIEAEGTETDSIFLLAYPTDTERPEFNFSAMSENSSNRGIQVEGSYWHIKGIDVYGAGDNGMYITGDRNTIEFCTFSENSDSGLQISGGGSNNLILNCDSFNNADSGLEDADGFACKLDAGTDNKFVGCRAWQNLDDGWDGYLRNNDNITTYYENCWAFKNGYLKDGSAGEGDGNGFKTGGSDSKDLKHNAIFNNCLAVGNLEKGFDHNSNRGEVEIYNSAGYFNGRNNYNFNSGNNVSKLTVKNSVSYVTGRESDKFNGQATDITNNSWQNGVQVDNTDFISLDMDQLSNSRKADGSLPDITFMHLNAESDLIDAGVNVGLEFNGSAPDLGAFEFE